MGLTPSPRRLATTQSSLAQAQIQLRSRAATIQFTLGMGQIPSQRRLAIILSTSVTQLTQLQQLMVEITSKLAMEQTRSQLALAVMKFLRELIQIPLQRGLATTASM